MNNYSEDQVSDLNQAMIEVGRLCYPAAGESDQAKAKRNNPMTTLTPSETAAAQALAARMIKHGISAEQFAANSSDMLPAYADMQDRVNARMVDACLTIPEARQTVIRMAYDACVVRHG